MSLPDRGTRPKLVHTFHGHVLQGYFGRPQQRGFIELERKLARRTDALIAVSPEVRDELLDLRIGRPEQYQVVPLGFDLGPLLEVGSPGGPGGGCARPSGCRAGPLGRKQQWAGSSPSRTTPPSSAVDKVPGLHLAVLGDGELRSRLESLAVDLGISERVHFTGWWLDVPAVLADLDVVVLSSINEGTPVALIEALAAGRPVVATDVGGVRHVVQEAETGWLCRAGDADGLSLLLRRVLAEPQMAKLMAQEGRRRVVERFAAAGC